MSESGEAGGIRGKELTLQDLAVARVNTETISQFLQQQLLGYLATLGQILLPDRLLGKHVGFKGEVAGADKALAELQASYQPFTGAPYSVPREFETEWLTEIGTRLEIYRWEYPLTLGSRTISIASPARWILTYTAPYTVAQMPQALAQKENRRPAYIRQFIINALVIKQLIARNAGLQALFADLGYKISFETSSHLPNLPLVVLTSRLPSFRPADDLVATATALSGVSAFIELIDLDAVEEIVDPLKQQISNLLSKA